MSALAKPLQDYRPRDYDSYRALARSHDEEWRNLCARFLPLSAPDSVWRYSRASAPDDPDQGWKLHVSSTILTANRVLEVVGPFLRARGVMFKAPFSLSELEKINSGIFYGYSQVGKFITVYPRTDGEAASLAAGLHRLTRGLRAPAVPFDLRYRAGGCVFFRYGAFKDLSVETPDGVRTPVIRNADGNFVPDLRLSVPPRPAWAGSSTARRRGAASGAPAPSPLQTTYRVFSALTQRGKGGVYKALDLSVRPPRLCIIKEGRRGGEVHWDGRDGRWRVEHEGCVLETLGVAGVTVPRVYSSFEAEENFYLVTEFVEGESLQTLLASRRRKLPVRLVLRYGASLAALLARIHAAGWVWRDCKPANLIVTGTGDLRPLDFEGACRADSPDRVGWGTPPFCEPEGAQGEGGLFPVGGDLYSLGAVLYLLLTGGAPAERPPRAVLKARRNVPSTVRELITELLDADPRRRPDAAAVEERLKRAAAAL